MLDLFRGLTAFAQIWYELNAGTYYTLQGPFDTVNSPAFVRGNYKILNNLGLRKLKHM